LNFELGLGLAIYLQEPIHIANSTHRRLTRSTSLDDLVQEIQPESETVEDEELVHARSSNELQRFNKDMAWSRGECGGLAGSRKQSVVGCLILLNLLESVHLLD